MRPINFCAPYMITTISKPKTKNDLKRMLLALKSYAKEDSNFMVYLNETNKHTTIAGYGESHLNSIVDRISSEFNLDINVLKTQVLYKETISKTVVSEGRFVRQSSSLCRYGHCWIELEPKIRDSGNEFVNNIIEETIIPSEYIPSVSQGIQQAMTCGVLGDFPVVDVKATLFNGSYHEYDSDQMSYKIAGLMAFRNGMKQADPVILEPIMKVKIEIAECNSTDVINEIHSILGKKGAVKSKDGISVWTIDVPLRELAISETLNYKLKGKGNCSVIFGNYDEVPQNIKENIIHESSLMGTRYQDLFYWSKWGKEEEEYHLNHFVESFWE
ncbi:Elongation factor G [compost metagenome]